MLWSIHITDPTLYHTSTTTLTCTAPAISLVALLSRASKLFGSSPATAPGLYWACNQPGCTSPSALLKHSVPSISLPSFQEQTRLTMHLYPHPAQRPITYVCTYVCTYVQIVFVNILCITLCHKINLPMNLKYNMKFHPVVNLSRSSLKTKHKPCHWMWIIY